MVKSKDNKKGGALTQHPGPTRMADPSARGILRRSGGPSIRSSPSGSIVISNTERIGNAVNTNSELNYTQLGMSLNPASNTVFPWLNSVVKSYQLYRWKKLTISYVPLVGTTFGGQVEMGIFYSTEDFTNWLATTSTGLSPLGDYACGPPYAGGLMNSDSGKRSKADWFGVAADTSRLHTAIPWLRVDPGTASAELGQFSVGAWLAVQAYAPVTASAVGLMYASYEIEVLNPTVSSVQSTFLDTSAIQVGGVKFPDSDNHCNPGPCIPFPPPRPSKPPTPKPGDIKEEEVKL